MTTIALTCTIPGTPQQQGSKTRNAYGTMYEANRNLKPWRAHAITQLRAAWAGEPITHGVHVTARPPTSLRTLTTTPNPKENPMPDLTPEKLAELRRAALIEGHDAAHYPTSVVVPTRTLAVR